MPKPKVVAESFRYQTYPRLVSTSRVKKNVCGGVNVASDAPLPSATSSRFCALTGAKVLWTTPPKAYCCGWPPVSRQPQQYAFGGVVHKTFAPVKAQNRLLVAEGKGASLATFTPPHTFFFTREVDTNLGYVWYRKDSTTTFAFGIRQADAEENPQYADNFALFNAPPGT